jgi:hypothetical protein
MKSIDVGILERRLAGALANCHHKIFERALWQLAIPSLVKKTCRTEWWWVSYHVLSVTPNVSRKAGACRRVLKQSTQSSFFHPSKFPPAWDHDRNQHATILQNLDSSEFKSIQQSTPSITSYHLHWVLPLPRDSDLSQSPLTPLISC